WRALNLGIGVRHPDSMKGRRCLRCEKIHQGAGVPHSELAMKTFSSHFGQSPLSRGRNDPAPLLEEIRLPYRRTTNSEPLPSSLRTFMLPPCASTMARAMASPRPVRPSAPARDLSAR